MSKVFITADLHLGHTKAAEFRGFHSVNQHNNTIIDNWNSVVGKRDSVFVLGDAVFGEQNFHLLGMLNGTKKLIMGNHDKYPIAKYMEYFTQVFGCIKYKDCILSHIPVHESQFERFKYNIHEHLHDKIVGNLDIQLDTSPNKTPEQCRELLIPNFIPDTRYINVSLEQTDYKPVEFNTLSI